MDYIATSLKDVSKIIKLPLEPGLLFAIHESALSKMDERLNVILLIN